MNIINTKELMEQNMVDELTNLQNDKYISKSNLEKQEKINKKQQLDDEKKIEKEQNKAFKAQNRAIQQEKIDAKQQEKKEKEEQQNDDDESQFLGKDRRQLINRISQYKELFSEELKMFKIKKNSSIEELKAYIIEIQCVIETSSIDTFMMDSIYTVMNLIEPITAKTKFNIIGLTNLLKSNKQFNSLTKQIFLKYGCYSNVSPEYQVLLIIICH